MRILSLDKLLVAPIAISVIFHTQTVSLQYAYFVLCVWWSHWRLDESDLYDMTDKSQQCPSALNQCNNTTRTCGKNVVAKYPSIPLTFHIHKYVE